MFPCHIVLCSLSIPLSFYIHTILRERPGSQRLSVTSLWLTERKWHREGKKEQMCRNSLCVWYRGGVSRHRRVKDEPLTMVKLWLEGPKLVGAIGSCSQVLSKLQFWARDVGSSGSFMLSLLTSWSRESRLSLYGDNCGKAQGLRSRTTPGPWMRCTGRLCLQEI